MGVRCDELTESEVGEVVQQGDRVAIIGVFEVEIQVPENDVICRSKGLSSDDVGDGVIELRSRSWGSVEESTPEGSLETNVDLESHVFGGAEGVFGVG
ncbi:hypothetical protein NDU88_003451 [Pleurodeles waltl]|uniref:Uncharacterized protein n=1 Tax=Pleurodeles waltl TaxID=8319 RepID=A0AAV7NJX7_PLEWA|nr:hypothetical protein NDU88_003451 [Pleurodeles waltl]